MQTWDQRHRTEIAEKDKTIEALQQELMISGKGGSPGQPYDDPEKGKGPFVPAPPRDKLAGLRINPNTIMLPREPAPAESDDDYGEGDVQGHPDWKMAHGEGRGPQPKYHDEYNQPLDMPPWMQMFPDGKVREIPWMKEKYLNEHPELAAANNIQGFQKHGWQLNWPLHDWKQIDPAIRNDPDFHGLRLRKIQA